MDVLMLVIRFHMWLIKVFMLPYRFICSLKTRKTCPPVKNLLLMHSAKKLSHLIRTRQAHSNSKKITKVSPHTKVYNNVSANSWRKESMKLTYAGFTTFFGWMGITFRVTSEEIVRTYISRIQEVNPTINAVVDERFNDAIAEAKEIDKFLQLTQKTEEELEKETPLLGVPITVKESIAVAGMSNAAGVWHNEIPLASSDAEIVTLVKYAGAVPLCVTNTPELCLYWETFNNVTGLTRNPYDTRRTVGGSSGGEAALLSSAGSVIGLGSDICGSLRLPPHFTGVYGHKPSPEIISIQGHVPGCDDEKWADVFVLGPMTRYAEDMALLFPILTKPEVRPSLRLDEPVNIKTMKVYYVENDTNRETILAMRRFAAYLRHEYGINAQQVEFKYTKNASDIFNLAIPNMMPMQHVHCLYYNEETKTYSIWKHILKKFACMSKVTFHVILFGFVLASSKILEARRPAAQIAKEKLHNELKNLLGDNGVLLFPTFSNVAHYHKEILHKVVETSYLTLFNVMGMPSTQCPAGYNSKGLPFGFQVTALRNNDRLTIAMAQEVEKFFGGWKPPSNKIKKNAIVDNFLL